MEPPVPTPSPHLEATPWFSRSAGAPIQVVDFGGHHNLASCLSPQLPVLVRGLLPGCCLPCTFAVFTLLPPEKAFWTRLALRQPPVFKMLPEGRALPEPSSSPWAYGAQSVLLPCGLTSSTSVPCELGDNSQEYQLPEFTQTHIHRVSDAIQPPSKLQAFNKC